MAGDADDLRHEAIIVSGSSIFVALRAVSTCSAAPENTVQKASFPEAPSSIYLSVYSPVYVVEAEVRPTLVLMDHLFAALGTFYKASSSDILPFACTPRIPLWRLKLR